MSFQFNGFSQSTADVWGRAEMKAREVLGHGARLVKSGNLQAHRLCSHGPQSRTTSAPAGWVSLKPCCSFLRQGTDKSVSLRGVKAAATCHSILVLLELYAQLIAPIGRLNSEKAETEASADSVFSLAHILRFLFLDWHHRCKEVMQLPRVRP